MAAPSKWALFMDRSARIAKDSVMRAVRMNGLNPAMGPTTLFTFRSQADMAQYVVGSDKDIGGNSSAHLDIGSDGRGRFWGEMRTDVKPHMEGKIRGGYAGFRNKMRPSLFGNVTDDASLHQYLALRVRAGGDPRTRNGYFVNIQTDGPVQSDLWQHRLYLRKDGEWEDVLIPFSSFILTNSGEAVSSDMTMMREQIRSIGISLLGGKANVQGPFELGIDSIGLTNDKADSEKD
ncbi:hypothetical protein FRC02_001727 [Tulasnella sp. 418]|nr:hypothetical protein FRC02_001727 [Tulasnella sp. 418]